MPFLETSIAAHSSNMDQNPEELMARFEELSVLETEFEEVELEIRKQPLALCSIRSLKETGAFSRGTEHNGILPIDSVLEHG